MSTKIATTKNSGHTGTGKQWIVKDSADNLIAVAHTAATSFTPYISTDGGSTWTAGDTSFSANDNQSIDIVIDGNDVIHAIAANPSNVYEAYYHQFTIGTGGSVTVNVNGESVHSDANGKQNETAITVNSSGTIYALVEYSNKIMGSTYINRALFRRDGASSWTDLGLAFSASYDHWYGSLAVDNADDIHCVAGKSHATWNKWDASAGSFVGEEEPYTSGSLRGNIAIDESTNEPVTLNEGYVLKRQSGSWSRDQFTSDNVGFAFIAYIDSKLWVIHRDSGNDNLHLSRASFGNFTTSQETIHKSSDILGNPSIWYQYNHTRTGADYLFKNHSTDDLYYDSYGYSKSVSQSLTAGIGTAPADHTSKRARRTARALMETGGE